MSDEWPEYESHKVVRAAKIVAVVFGGPDGEPIHVIVEYDGGTGQQVFVPTVPEMLKKAEIGGYAMLYPDGFKSVSPAKAFEEGYTRK